MSKRPNLTAYFRARIDWHTYGMAARSTAHLPPEVERVRGDVTDREIVAVMRDGTEHRWTGGRYASRRVNLCYPPLMPKPTKESTR